MRRLAATALLALLTFAAPAAAQETHQHSGNMRHVLNLPYEARNGTIPNYGTDIEFARLAGKQYALAGSYRNGLQIVDITDPEQSRIAAVYDCGITQGDPQVFTRGERTYVTYTSDTFGDGTSTCYREAAALGFEVLKADGTGRNGTFVADITEATDIQFVVIDSMRFEQRGDRPDDVSGVVSGTAGMGGVAGDRGVHTPRTGRTTASR